MEMVLRWRWSYDGDGLILASSKVDDPYVRLQMRALFNTILSDQAPCPVSLEFFSQEVSVVYPVAGQVNIIINTAHTL